MRLTAYFLVPFLGLCWFESRENLLQTSLEDVNSSSNDTTSKKVKQSDPKSSWRVRLNQKFVLSRAVDADR